MDSGIQGVKFRGHSPLLSNKKIVCSHSDSKNSTLERWTSKERTVRPRQLSSLNSEGWTLTALTQPNCQTNIKCIRWWTSQAQKWLKAKQRWYQKASCSSMFLEKMQWSDFRTNNIYMAAGSAQESAYFLVRWPIFGPSGPYIAVIYGLYCSHNMWKTGDGWTLGFRVCSSGGTARC